MLRIRFLGLLLTTIFLIPFHTTAQDIDPKEIIDRVDRLLRGDSSHGRVEMTVVAKHWKRTVGMEIWSEGVDKALVRITSPKKEQGIATLKVGRDIWNYLPKIDRTIRVPSSMMGSSWMGSHFTNDELVKESQLVTDYEIELTYEGLRDGVEVYEFRLIPHEDAAVVWGAMTYQVRKADLIPAWARYYDEDGELKRTMTFEDVRQMGGRKIPTLIKLVPADSPAEYTQMLYHDLKFDLELPKRIFSLSELRR